MQEGFLSFKGNKDWLSSHPAFVLGEMAEAYTVMYMTTRFSVSFSFPQSIMETSVIVFNVTLGF